MLFPDFLTKGLLAYKGICMNVLADLTGKIGFTALDYRFPSIFSAYSFPNDRIVHNPTEKLC